MIIEHRQRIAVGLIRHAELALEVDLPQVVGLGAFKPREVQPDFRGLRRDPPMPLQDRRDRARCRNALVSQMPQPGANLTTAPHRMLIANLQHQLLDLDLDRCPLSVVRCPLRRDQRTPRLVRQSPDAAFAKPFQPLVTRLTRAPDLATPAERGCEVWRKSTSITS